MIFSSRARIIVNLLLPVFERLSVMFEEKICFDPAGLPRRLMLAIKIYISRMTAAQIHKNNLKGYLNKRL